MDGTEYEFEGDIPDLPHPNCQCHIEVVENGDGDGEEDGEPCDCWDELDEILAEADELEGDVSSEIDELNSIEEEVESDFTEYQSLLEEVQNAVVELEEIEPCGDNCVAITGFAANIKDDSKLEEKVYNIIKNIDEAREVYEIFVEHKQEMIDTADGFDKYYHAKANCESAELGIIQGLWAVIFSIGKEIKDFKYKVFEDHQDFKKVFIDCMQDLRADLHGLMKAKEHGYCSDKVKDVGDIFKK